MKPSNCYDYYFEEYGKIFLPTILDWEWFKAQAIAESNLNPEAVSPVGAVGVMQLMPDTSKEMAAKLGIVNDPQIPHLNIQMGIGYDLRCWNIFKEEKGLERIRFMLGAYIPTCRLTRRATAVLSQPGSIPGCDVSWRVCGGLWSVGRNGISRWKEHER